MQMIYSSEVENLSGILKVLGSIPNIINIKSNLLMTSCNLPKILFYFLFFIFFLKFLNKNHYSLYFTGVKIIV